MQGLPEDKCLHATHSCWACPRLVQASLAMMTMLSAGLCLAEAQWITLLATGARPPTLVLTR